LNTKIRWVSLIASASIVPLLLFGGVAEPARASLTTTRPAAGASQPATTPVATTPPAAATEAATSAADTPADTTPVAVAAATTTPTTVVENAPDQPKMCVSDAAIKAARQYARSRPGSVSFAVFERSTLRSFGGGTPYRSASLVKAMLLTADLRRHASAHAALSSADRARLGSMIHVSDNAAATATFNLVGANAVRAVARLAGMRNYRVGYGWGTSQLTASDQARFWGRLNRMLPGTYREYARGLLRGISHDQVWGGAPVARSKGYATMFKSGWLPQPSGWLVHQGMRLERGHCTVGIAVLTGHQPSMAAGVETIRGVTARLL
jgi:hypothetical protein